MTCTVILSLSPNLLYNDNKDELTTSSFCVSGSDSADSAAHRRDGYVARQQAAKPQEGGEELRRRNLKTLLKTFRKEGTEDIIYSSATQAATSSLLSWRQEPQRLKFLQIIRYLFLINLNTWMQSLMCTEMIVGRVPHTQEKNRCLTSV